MSVALARGKTSNTFYRNITYSRIMGRSSVYVGIADVSEQDFNVSWYTLNLIVLLCLFARWQAFWAHASLVDRTQLASTSLSKLNKNLAQSKVFF